MTLGPRIRLSIAYAATLLTTAAITGSCLTSRSMSGGHGLGGVALLLGSMAINLTLVAIGVVALPFAKARAIGSVALAGGTGGFLAMWLTLFRDDPSEMVDAMWMLLGR